MKNKRFIKILPFIFMYDGNIIYKRKYILEGEGIIKFRIYYMVDFLSVLTVNNEFYITEQSNTNVIDIIKNTVLELNKLFK